MALRSSSAASKRSAPGSVRGSASKSSAWRRSTIAIGSPASSFRRSSSGVMRSMRSSRMKRRRWTYFQTSQSATRPATMLTTREPELASRPGRALELRAEHVAERQVRRPPTPARPGCRRGGSAAARGRRRRPAAPPSSPSPGTNFTNSSERGPWRANTSSVRRTHESGSSETLHTKVRTLLPRRRPASNQTRSARTVASTARPSAASAVDLARARPAPPPPAARARRGAGCRAARPARCRTGPRRGARARKTRAAAGAGQVSRFSCRSAAQNPARGMGRKAEADGAGPALCSRAGGLRSLPRRLGRACSRREAR